MTKVVRIKRIPLKGNFFAINLFGVIFAVQELSAEDLNHELIHTAQQRELLFVGFYLWYVIEWFCLYLKYHDLLEAYFHIRFEQEAYRHGDDLNYLKVRKHYHYNQ